MPEVVRLSDKRPPVIYSVTIAEGWDGSLSVQVHDIQDDPRSRFAVADALSRASQAIKRGERGDDEETAEETTE